MMNGGIIGLVGVQGVGKSSALQAIHFQQAVMEYDLSRKIPQKENIGGLRSSIIRFKWRRRNELFRSLMNGTHEASGDFRRAYRRVLLAMLRTRGSIGSEWEKCPERLDVDWAETTLGRIDFEALRQKVWLALLRSMKMILIDTPDYSKTDRRMMAKDLDEIYWTWNALSHTRSLDNDVKPSLVLAIQKEMFQRHYFFDKMQKIELQPLRPEQMLKAYTKRFKTAHPFTEDALLTLARMSRGIFRRFLRYITQTIDAWVGSPGPRKPIDTGLVKKTITTERLAEDMEKELLDLFPKQSDLRFQAVQILMHLEESGPLPQSELAEQLDIPPYAMTRLLAKLESNHYVTRKRSGNDKIVSLRDTSRTNEEKSMVEKPTNNPPTPNQEPADT
jgi:DNA-binding MarR family transcriptional regulator